MTITCPTIWFPRFADAKDEPSEVSAKSLVCFLDRDGTLVKDSGYVHLEQDLEILPGVVDGLRKMAEYGWKFVIVSNQAGIAKGHFNRSQTEVFNRKLVELLYESEIHIAAVAYCPHHPEGVVEEYRTDCESRKPRPGMLATFLTLWGLSPDACVLLGNAESDILAAESLAIRGCLVESGGFMETVDRIIGSN